MSTDSSLSSTASPFAITSLAYGTSSNEEANRNRRKYVTPAFHSETQITSTLWVTLARQDDSSMGTQSIVPAWLRAAGHELPADDGMLQVRIPVRLQQQGFGIQLMAIQTTDGQWCEQLTPVELKQRDVIIIDGERKVVYAFKPVTGEPAIEVLCHDGTRLTLPISRKVYAIRMFDLSTLDRHRVKSECIRPDDLLTEEFQTWNKLPLSAVVRADEVTYFPAITLRDGAKVEHPRWKIEGHRLDTGEAVTLYRGVLSLAVVFRPKE